jgi:hypothetical protein
LAAQVKARSPPLEQWRSFVYCEAMAAGQLLGEVDHFPGAALLLLLLPKLLMLMLSTLLLLLLLLFRLQRHDKRIATFC